MDADGKVVAFRRTETGSPSWRNEAKARARPIRGGARSATDSPQCRIELLRMRLARFAAIFGRLKTRLERYRSHRMLMELTDFQLQDIGLSRMKIVDRSWEHVHLRVVSTKDRPNHQH